MMTSKLCHSHLHLRVSLAATPVIGAAVQIGGRSHQAVFRRFDAIVVHRGEHLIGGLLYCLSSSASGVLPLHS